MRTINVQQQLEEMLCQSEKRIIHETLQRVDRQDKELICLGLLALAKYPNLRYSTDDPFVSIMVSGLMPYVEQSQRKAADINWCSAHPDDAP